MNSGLDILGRCVLTMLMAQMLHFLIAKCPSNCIIQYDATKSCVMTARATMLLHALKGNDSNETGV